MHINLLQHKKRDTDGHHLQHSSPTAGMICGSRTATDRILPFVLIFVLNLCIFVIPLLLAPWYVIGFTVKGGTEVGLVGWWKFDEGSGTMVNDSTGNKNRGTLSGTTKPTWTAGKHGKALQFDGTSGYVDAGNVNLGTGARTYTAWVKASSISGTTAIVGKDTGTASTEAGMIYQANGTLYWRVRDATTEGQRTFANTLNTNKWHLIVGTYDGSSMNAYFDGVLSNGGVTSIPTSVPTNAIPLQIGARGNGTLNFSGLIDDVRIYNRALSAAEVASLYKSGETVVNKIEPVRLNKGLVGYWSFDGNTISGTSVIDLSGQGHTGTMGCTGSGCSSPVKVPGKIGQGLKFSETEILQGMTTMKYFYTQLLRTVNTRLGFKSMILLIGQHIQLLIFFRSIPGAI